MRIIVQKFGGTSLASVDLIQHCARRIMQTRDSGYNVVTVVSAMGHTTDHLIELANEVTDNPPRRELDMLLATGEQVSASLMAMTLNKLGAPAVSVTATMLGIVTNPVHCNARIRTINCREVEQHLQAGRIVVAAGFQGMSTDGNITTLGRGGSDTTAVALAAALSGRHTVDVCEINTDVDGVYTADPRYVPDARKLARISYEEMVELASLGAGVLHTRSVLCGQRYRVPIHVRHSTRDCEGTMIIDESPEMETVSVVGCALTPDLGRISVRDLPNQPGVEGRLFQMVADADILVDDIIQNESGSRAHISFTVETRHLADTKIVVDQFINEIGEGKVDVELGLAKVSAVGVGMRTHTNVAATMFKALGDAGINIANITTSEIKISCIVPKQSAEDALRTVHKAFNLGEEPRLDNDTTTTTQQQQNSQSQPQQLHH